MSVCVPCVRVCLRAGARGAAGPGARPRRCAGGCGLSSSLAPRRSLPVASAVTWVMCWSLKELIAPEPVQKQPVVAWGSAGSGGKEGAVSTGRPGPEGGAGCTPTHGTGEAACGHGGQRRRAAGPAAEGGGKEGGGERFLPPHSLPVLCSLPPCSRAPSQRPRVSAPRRGPRVHPSVRSQYGQLTFLASSTPCACSRRGEMGDKGPERPCNLRDTGSAPRRGGGTPVPCPAGPLVSCPAERASRPAPR